MDLNITALDIERGYKLDCQLPWNQIIRPLSSTDPKVVELLNTMHSLIPNESDVEIKQGKPHLAWTKQRCTEEVFSWIDHCLEQGLITPYEVALTKQELRIVMQIR